ncbi:BTB/POZ and TAZ domain-containing protein 1 isoform X2 [Diospyros lotus]|nr:BTB/POZ and TAZ domain-containing protein 1 isoform X2 [Diospyros lotus]
MDKYGIHLLALSHVFLVPQLKQRCTKALGGRLTIDNVVDVLQLARLCDASDLYLKCMKLVSNNFKSVEMTEGWKFVQDNDPWLELEILQFIDETELRKKRTRRHREEQSLYLLLNEAMECLEHICREGCTNVRPYDMEPTKNRGPCSRFATCQGLQLLIRHFAMCKRRVNGGCSRCKRMWQLLRLHSSICDQPDICRVPLCRQFKLKEQQEKRGDDARWRLLVRKVVSAKAISSLSLPKRKREEEARSITDHPGIRSFRLHDR